LAVANSYGAMICDIQLPDLDGPDVVKEMRQRRCGPKMVIFISGAVKAAPRNEGSDTFFIRKPFNPSEILTLLNRCR